VGVIIGKIFYITKNTTNGRLQIASSSLSNEEKTGNDIFYRMAYTAVSKSYLFIYIFLWPLIGHCFLIPNTYVGRFVIFYWFFSNSDLIIINAARIFAVIFRLYCSVLLSQVYINIVYGRFIFTGGYINIRGKSNCCLVFAKRNDLCGRSVNVFMIFQWY